MFTNGTHTENYMQIFSNRINEIVPKWFRRVLDFLFDGMWPYKSVDLVYVFFFGEEIRNLSCVQNVIYVFKERLIGYLNICENE